MIEPRERPLSELIADKELIGKALEKAVREALKSHRQTGDPIVVWQDGKVVWVPPDQIPLYEKEETTPENKSNK